MAGKSEYKLVSGTDGGVAAEVAKMATGAWKPILMTAVAVGNTVRLYVILEHPLGS